MTACIDHSLLTAALVPNGQPEPFGWLNDDTLAHHQAQDYHHPPAWAPVGRIGSTRWLAAAILSGKFSPE